MSDRSIDVRLIGLSVLLLGVIWLTVAAGTARGMDDLGLGQQDETLSVECGRRFGTATNAVPVVPPIRARVAIDDAWAGLGQDEQEVRLLVVEAAGLLRGTGLSVMPVEIVRWNPPSSARLPREVLEAAKDAMPLDGVDIVIVLTAGSTTRKDGAADVGGRHVVVQHHSDARAKDVAVLAHEIGHLLGAHHGCDAGTDGGIMGTNGFSNAELLCSCTRAVITSNLAQFHRDAAVTP